MADQAPPTELPIGRGLRGRCPACGQGRLFHGFLNLRPRCECCDLDYGFVDAGDGPAVFVILIAGAIVVFAALLTEVAYQPPYWLHAALWFPLILAPSEATKTVTLGAQNFIGQFTTNWNAVLSALSLAILPVLILYLIFSRQLIRGITSGAVK